MNKKKIEEIIELMEKYGLSEIDVEEEGMRIHLSKGGRQTQAPVNMHLPGQPVQFGNNEVSTGETTEKTNLVDIKAPMVGTFYRSPSPDSNPYVEIGTIVNPGDVVCIIEAMKLMNEIKSEVKGKIVKIPVDNGQAVEFGQVLFSVEPV